MRVLGAVAVIVLLTGPAYAQFSGGGGGGPSLNMMPELASKTQEEKDADAARDKAYKESLKKIPDAKVSSDPWGTVRGPDAPKAATAKPRTKTGSTAN
jgi:hypothetical protein